MISFIEGTLIDLGDKYVLLNAGGLGYRLTILPKLKNILSKNKPPVNLTSGDTANLIKLFVHSQMNLREGTFDLYGFDKKEDLELFGLLISISGIGPKNAMNILSTVEAKHLKAAVVNEDTAFLKKISGLGPKTAQRLILELKNKVDHIDMGDMAGMDLGKEGQAMDALIALGYSPSQAKDALEATDKAKKLEDRVREALRMLGGR